MRKVLTALVLGLALLAMGCAGGQKMDKDAKIKCPKCGVEFPAEQGMH